MGGCQRGMIWILDGWLICCLAAITGCTSGGVSGLSPTVSGESSAEGDSGGTTPPMGGTGSVNDQGASTAGSGSGPSSGSGGNGPIVVVDHPPLFAPFNAQCGCLFQERENFTCENFEIKGVRLGAFAYAPAKGGRYAVAAPHGWADASTDLIVANLAPAGDASSWGKLIGHSFLGNCMSGYRYNVNRPGVLNNETCTTDPKAVSDQQSLLVYHRYLELIDLVAPPESRKLYAEIHGQDGDRLITTIEIATDHMTQEEAQKIKGIFLGEVKLLDLPEKVVLKISIEPLNEVSFNTLPIKTCGSLEHVAPVPVLHAELPSMLRQESKLPDTIAYLSSVFSRIAAEVYP